MATRRYGIAGRIELEDAASDKVEKLDNRFTKLAKTWGIALTAGAAVATSAIRKLVQGIDAVTEAAASEQEQVTKLDAALSRFGDRSSSLSSALQQQANALQAITGVSNEQILSAQALIATLGVQEEKLQDATQAAVDLSAAYGISLESAARNVGRTMGGFAGELGEIIPELRELSRSALLAGEGIDVISQAVSGRAAEQAKTYAGLVQQIRNEINELQKDLGRAVVESDNVAEAQKTQLKGWQALREELPLVQAAIERIATGWTNLQSIGLLLGQKVLQLAGWFAEQDRVLFGLGESADKAGAKLQELATSQDVAAKAAERAARIEKELDALRKDSLDTLSSLGITLKEDLNKQLEENARKMEQVNELERQGLITRLQYEEATRKLAVEQAGLNAVLDGTVASVDEYRTELENAQAAQDAFATSAFTSAEALDGVRAGADNAARSLRQYDSQLRNVTPSGDDLNSTPGGTFTYTGEGKLLWDPVARGFRLVRPGQPGYASGRLTGHEYLSFRI